MLTIITRTAKTPADAPLTSSSIALSTVSRVWVLVMITETPRASRMTMAGPTISPAPRVISETISFSPILATTPTTMAAMMNSIASCGNHQFSSNQYGSVAVS
jgi:hypothetical protein